MKKNENAAEVKKTATGKKKKKVNVKNVLATLMVVFLVACIAVGIVALLYINRAIKESPQFNIDDFRNTESTKIFDTNGEVIADVGVVNRENASYDEIPQNFIDAMVAVEDSRFFEHNGFDLPRFAKAMLVNLKETIRQRRIVFSEGASTLSMQLIRNVYFTDDATAKTRTKSIDYKIQQIYLAIKAEQEINKKRIFELYINRINFGASTTRGIKGAAQYYFGKDVSELTLSESAYLAGVVNAPGDFNAYRHYEAAENRRNVVLNLMALHGYISKEECELAKSISLADQLVGVTTDSSQKYQAYINEVVDEVMELTGKDPYTVSMRIYTYMNPTVQDTIEAIQNGETKVEWPDDLMQCAIVSVDNHTGAILGVGGGRGTIAAKGFSRVSDMKKQPGSSVKPFLSYALAFEYLGWSTQHMIKDEPVAYRGTNIVLNNFSRTYKGEVLLPYAIGASLNVPAYNTLLEVVDTVGTPRIVEYLNSLGFTDITTDTFDLGYSIGGSSFEVTVKQMAAAHGAMCNGGYYVQPHTVSRIEFLDGTEPYETSYPSVKVLSEESAYLVSRLMEQNVSHNYQNYMQLLDRSYEVYAKTGTTNYDDSFVDIGIPAGVSKDKWMIASSGEYTTAVWCGYDMAINEECYYSSKKSALNIPGNINSLLLDALAEDHKPENVQRPSDIVGITHVKGLYPYTAPVEGMNPDLIVSGLINKKNYSLKALEAPQLAALPQFTANVVKIENGNITLDLNWTTYPDPTQLIVSDGNYEVPVPYSSRVVTCTKLYDPTWVFGAVKYKAQLPDGQVIQSDTEKTQITIPLPTTGNADIAGFYAFETGGGESNRVVAKIDLSIDMTKQNLTNIDAISKFKSQYNLGWQLKGIPITDPNTQQEGAIKSATTTPADLFTRVDLPISELNTSTAVIEYYYKADDVTLGTSRNEIESQKGSLGFSEWSIRTTPITNINQTVGSLASVNPSDIKLGQTYPYAYLYRPIEFVFYADVDYVIPTTFGQLVTELGNYGITVGANYPGDAQIDKVNGKAPGETIHLSVFVNGVDVSIAATPEPTPDPTPQPTPDPTPEG